MDEPRAFLPYFHVFAGLGISLHSVQSTLTSSLSDYQKVQDHVLIYFLVASKTMIQMMLSTGRYLGLPIISSKTATYIRIVIRISSQAQLCPLGRKDAAPGSRTPHLLHGALQERFTFPIHLVGSNLRDLVSLWVVLVALITG